MLIDDAIAALKANSIAEPRKVPPPTPEQIRAAEAALGLRFPPSFLSFLQLAGAYALPFWETYWVGDESLADREIVAANRAEREDSEVPLPPYLVAFHNNGCGDHYCFDTTRPDLAGEYPIVFWDHESTAEANMADLVVMAPTFAHWLMDQVESSTA